MQYVIPGNTCHFLTRNTETMSIEDIEKAIHGIQEEIPATVTSWQIEIGPDATDEDAIWVWVTLPDEDLKDEIRTTIRTLLKNAIREALHSTVWVYVRFRAASEVQPA